MDKLSSRVAVRRVKEPLNYPKEAVRASNLGLRSICRTFFGFSAIFNHFYPAHVAVDMFQPSKVGRLLYCSQL